MIRCVRCRQLVAVVASDSSYLSGEVIDEAMGQTGVVGVDALIECQHLIEK
jgi:hypothetical protein